MSFYRLTFAAGLAVGFVAGTRAGRERYDQMIKLAKTAMESPAFQKAAGAAQAQASSAKQKVADRAPSVAQSAMHSVSDHVPLLKHRNGDSSDGKGGHHSRPFTGAGNGHRRSADS